MNALKKLDNVLKWAEEWILVLTGTTVMMMILVNAACRFLKLDWFGSEELTMFVAFWLYFMGAACASREKTHICADMFSLFTQNPNVLHMVSLVKNVISLVVCALFTWWCVNYVKWQGTMHAKSSVYKLPVIIATIPMMISFIFWTIYLVRDLADDLKMLSGGKPASEQKEG